MRAVNSTSGRIGVFQRDGLRFPTSDVGPLDGEPVLLLHGWPQDSRSWSTVASLLAAQGYRVFAPTLRGATREANPRSRRAFRTPEQLADAEAIIETIGRSVHVVGHDWGAALAWTLAARRPDLVRTMTAVSVPHPLAFMGGLRRPQQMAKSWYMAFFQLPLIPELVLASPSMRTRVFSQAGQTPEVARRDAARLGTYAMRRGGFNWYRGAAITAPREHGGTVPVPTLQVWSDRDVAISRRTVERAREYTTGPYELLVLEGVTHWIPDAVPEQLVSALVRHFERSERTSDAG